MSACEQLDWVELGQFLNPLPDEPDVPPDVPDVPPDVPDAPEVLPDEPELPEVPLDEPDEPPELEFDELELHANTRPRPSAATTMTVLRVEIMETSELVNFRGKRTSDGRPGNAFYSRPANPFLSPKRGASCVPRVREHGRERPAQARKGCGHRGASVRAGRERPRRAGLARSRYEVCDGSAHGRVHLVHSRLPCRHRPRARRPRRGAVGARVSRGGRRASPPRPRRLGRGRDALAIGVGPARRALRGNRAG